MKDIFEMKKKWQGFISLRYIVVLFFGLFVCSCVSEVEQSQRKPALMWFDAEANFGRFNQKDSIDFYLNKIKDLGFTHAVVDVRPITGEVLFDSQYAPRMEEWNGHHRGDFDYLGYFIEQGHKLGPGIIILIGVWYIAVILTGLPLCTILTVA